MFWRKRHPVSDNDLSAYTDGEIERSALVRVAAHLSTCETCRKQVAELRTLKAMLSALPEVQSGRSFAISPATTGQGARRAPAPRRTASSLAFAPALAMTVLVLLFAVDMAVIDVGRDEQGIGALGDAMDLRSESAQPEIRPAAAPPGATPAGRAFDGEPGPTPALGIQPAVGDDQRDAGAAAREAVFQDQDSTAQTVIRTLQLIFALVLLVTLFVWLRARIWAR
jgi:anti-sigma factor RsiW